MDIIKDISDSIHFFAKEYFPDQIVLSAQIALKFLFLAVVFFGMDFLIRKVVGILLKIVSDRSKSLRIKGTFRAVVFSSSFYQGYFLATPEELPASGFYCFHFRGSSFHKTDRYTAAFRREILCSEKRPI